MIDLLNCGWDAMHGRMVVAGGGRLKCPVSDCDYWAEKLSAESVLLSISALEADRDRLRELLRRVAAGAQVLQMQTAAEELKALEHTP